MLTVWKLDCLSRSLKDLLTILDKVEKAGAGFRSLTENIDSTTASGRMMMQMLGAFAEYAERVVVRSGIALPWGRGEIRRRGALHNFGLRCGALA